MLSNPLDALRMVWMEWEWQVRLFACVCPDQTQAQRVLATDRSICAFVARSVVWGNDGITASTYLRMGVFGRHVEYPIGASLFCIYLLSTYYASDGFLFGSKRRC